VRNVTFNNMSGKTIVVTGGSGYLGGAACVLLKEKGYTPISLDRVPSPGGDWETRLVDLADAEEARRAWEQLPQVDAVLHFAALALVAESVRRPDEYRRNNVQATRNCLEGAGRRGAKAFVHSSTCAVYGYPEKQPITERTPLAPISPYGESKLLSEQAIDSYSAPDGMRTLSLRYFNPAGALEGLRWGERHEPETHLIPLVLRAARTATAVSILGTDYPTPDGTCVRDYIHLIDLIEAHVLALAKLESQAELPKVVNLGGGRGYSVKEVVAAAERASRKKIASKLEARRPGDPPLLVADISTARRVLGWEPKRGLDEILTSQWAWETRGPSQK
jgi:UDP-glucose-4-epimerase GalE